MKKMTKRLACLVLALVLACCALPGVTYGATTSVDLNQNYLFRARTNAFSFGAGETANLTFTPQYTAEYTLKLYGHVTGGRNIRASLTNPDGTVTNFEYPNRTGSTVKDYSHPYLTATLEQGKTYTYSVWGWTATSTGATVDVDFTSGESGTLSQEVGLRLGYQDAPSFQRAFRHWFGMPPGEFRGRYFAQDEAQHIEHGGRGHIGHGHGGRAPEDGDARQRLACADLLQQQVAGHFEQEVADEEDAGAQAVDSLAELQVLQHLQLGEADVDAVYPGQDKEKDQKGDQAPGDLAVGGVHVGVRVRTGMAGKRVGGGSRAAHGESPVCESAAGTWGAFAGAPVCLGTVECGAGRCSCGGSIERQRGAVQQEILSSPECKFL